MQDHLLKDYQIDRHSSTPLYQQISDILVEQIQSDLLKPGDALPSEQLLMKSFEVSRFVIRQTLNNLARQGLIYTEHGRGSFVSHHRIDKPLEVLTSYQESMQKYDIPVQLKINYKNIVIPPPEVAKQLELSPYDQVFLLERISHIQDEPVNILISYISLKHIGHDAMRGFNKGSLYAYLRGECGVSLHQSSSYIEVTYAAKYEADLLNLPRSAVLLQISSLVYDKEKHPIEYTRIIYPAARFRFRFDSYMDPDADVKKRYILV
jgi:GntR family transcriptional regulator